MVQPRGPRVWVWVGILAALGLALWSTAFFLGDATKRTAENRVGADLGIGEQRSPILPAQPTPLHALVPLQTRDLGRLVHVRGVAESAVRSNALWVRSQGGRRILLRFEPAPPAEALARLRPGSAVSLDGYLEKISQAEFVAWMDTLGVRIPQPPPGRKFGDLPDPAFARVDSLFVKSFYVSVRPEALQSRPRPADADAAGEDPGQSGR